MTLAERRRAGARLWIGIIGAAGNICQRTMSPLKRLIFIAAAPMLWARHGIM